MQTFTTLFILSYGAVGDFCIHLFFLDRAHRANPHARYIVLATRNAPLLREMAVEYPFVEVRQITLRNVLILFLSTCLKKKVFVMPPSFFPVPRFAIFLAKLLTLYRGTLAGFTNKNSSLPLDITIEFNPTTLFYKNFSHMLVALGLPPDDSFTLSFAQDTSVLASLSKRYVAIAPFGSNVSKSLPPERWVALLEFLNKQYPEYAVALLGAPQDAETAAAFVARAEHTNAVVLCGVSFAKVAAVIAHSTCFVGIDSGLTHVAGVMQVVTVAIENLKTVTWLPQYNPNVVILVEPKDCLCRGDKTGECYREIDGIRYPRCMVDIPQPRIEKAITDILKKND